MLFILTNGVTRPSRTESPKDEMYHSLWARYCAFNSNNQYREDFIRRLELNRSFYRNEQWLDPEDLGLFFMDESGNQRNRLKFTHNVIRPMVEQYRGNALRMSFNAGLVNTSPRAISRKDSSLQEMLFHTRNAQNIHPDFAEHLKKQLPIGDNENETSAIHENLFVDEYVPIMNMFIKHVADLNHFDKEVVDKAFDLAFGGIIVTEYLEYAGHQYFIRIRPEDFFFDISCKKQDLSDSEYMGKLEYDLPTEIFEQYSNISKSGKDAIENYARTAKKTTDQVIYNYSGRVPKVTSYWLDCENMEYGYVLDEFGELYLARINYTEDGEEKPKYTDEDLVDPQTDRQKKVLDGKKSKVLPIEVIRFCSFIPQEALATTGDTEKDERIKDIVLDWGMLPYQENDDLEFSSPKFPLKASCWAFVDGQILSPIDDAISPQRMINRVISIAENQINNSRGSGTILDRSILDEEGGEAEALKNMNQSKPIIVDARGKGLQNVIGSYDGTVKAGTMSLFDVTKVIEGQIQQTSGVNEALKGESTGSDQLVGVTELLIQRGSLMQEPFYNAITDNLLQCYAAIATVGKKIYCDSERNLSIAVGEEGVKVIKITKDMASESFRCFLKRENTPEMLTQAGDQLLDKLIQLQKIDDKRYANLYGRSTVEQVCRGMRESAKEKEEVGRAQQKQQAQQMQQAQQNQHLDQARQAQQQQGMLDREDMQDAKNKNHDLDKIFAKSVGKTMEDAAKNKGAKAGPPPGALNKPAAMT